MRFRSTLAAGCLLAALAPIALTAQQPVQVPATLTLEDARRIARGNSPAYIKVQNDADGAAMSVRQRWSQFLPTLNTSLGFGGNSSTTSTGQDDYGGVVTNPEPLTVRNSNANQGFSLGLTLFDGGAMFRNLAAARADQDAAEAGVLASLSVEEAKVENDFFNARQMDMLVDVELQNLQKARATYERNQELFRVAAVNQVDLLEAQRTVLDREKSLRQRETEAMKARLTLAQTLGLDPSTSFTVAPETPEVFDPSTISVDAVVTQALEQSPSIRQRVATVAARRKSAAAAKGSWLPTVSTTFGWSRSTGEQGWGAIGELNPDRSRGYNLNFSFSFPVFDRFQRNVTISAANVAREDAEQDLRAARLDVEARVRSGLLDLQRAYQDFQLAQQLAQITQQQAELAEERFRLGALDFLNYQRIVDQNAQSQRDAVLARFVFNTARVTLEQTLGAPISR